MFNKPVNIIEARQELDKKSTIICPDTCVLLNLVTPRKPKNDDATWLSHLAEWNKQLNKCKSLCSNRMVGWIIPQQIKREFEFYSDGEKELQTLKSAEKDMVSESILESPFKDLNVEFNRLIQELQDCAKKCQTEIIQTAILLEELENDLCIYDAWSLVYNNSFPNKKKQQMKDSVILSHLYQLYGFGTVSAMQTSNSSPDSLYPNTHEGHSPTNLPDIYFWTFDEFSKMPSSRFPQREARRYIEIKNNVFSIPNGIAQESQI